MSIEKIDYAKEILRLKAKKNAVILAHYYQDENIQKVADFIGDSLALAQEASKTEASIIVFCGVHFMAETAKIINPTKKVIVPDLEASCSLSESCPPVKFRNFIEANPDHVVVSYINCSAEIKAMSDIICTSSNAEKVISSIPIKKKIIFAPDKNLGSYLIHKTTRPMKLWEGTCYVHEAFSIDKILELAKKYPEAEFIAHPESEEPIRKLAKFVGSTAGMIKYVKASPATTFIVATEAGILYQMKREAPNKTLIPAPSYEENTCACSECSYMKVNTLEKLYDCILNETPEITLTDKLIKKAYLPLKRMLDISAN